MMIPTHPSELSDEVLSELREEWNPKYFAGNTLGEAVAAVMYAMPLEEYRQTLISRWNKLQDEQETKSRASK